MTNDSQQMGTLLSRMTSEESNQIQFDADQVKNIVEIVIPRMVSGMPGMPAGMQCTVDRDEDGKGWTIRVQKPA